ncbi:MAG: hypothetical protein Kow00114_25140 [Kiloniellaceae bacterium]
MTIARKKLAVVHLAKARLGLDEDSYRDLLRQAAGVGSSKQLDDAGFAAVMDRFKQLGFVSTAAKANLAGRHWSMASDGQVAKLRKLWETYTDGKGDDASLGKWLDRQGWASALRFLGAPDAQKAIGALSRMVQRKASRQEAI